jgi:hypothetical protein
MPLFISLKSTTDPGDYFKDTAEVFVTSLEPQLQLDVKLLHMTISLIEDYIGRITDYFWVMTVHTLQTLPKSELHTCQEKRGFSIVPLLVDMINRPLSYP